MINFESSLLHILGLADLLCSQNARNFLFLRKASCHEFKCLWLKETLLRNRKLAIKQELVFLCITHSLHTCEALHMLHF